MNTIHELHAQGLSLHEIGRHLGLARNTVRKYVRGAAVAAARPPKPQKLDPFKEQIRRWVTDDHLLNGVTMRERLRPLGDTGGISQLKAFVHQLRPPKTGRHPVRRYETAAGEQMQFDWGEFRYNQAGSYHKVFGFIAILSHSRMRFVVFNKRCDVATLIRCLLLACAYFGGLTRTMRGSRSNGTENPVKRIRVNVIWHHNAEKRQGTRSMCAVRVPHNLSEQTHVS